MRWRLAGMLMVLVAAGPNPGAPDSRPTGSIAGTMHWSGAVPEAISITVSDGTTLRHREVVVDAKTKGLRDVAVIVLDAPAQPKLKDAKPALIDQREWIFTPRVIAIQHGRPVRFENNDTVNHSVMAVSTVAENQLNSVAGPGMPIMHTFAPQKLPVMIGCSLHPWMRAWVYVVQHPWLAVSDNQGRFRIENVPPGKYTVLFVHPDTNRQERRTIQVEAGKTAQVALDLHKAE